MSCGCLRIQTVQVRSDDHDCLFPYRVSSREDQGMTVYHLRYIFPVWSCTKFHNLIKKALHGYRAALWQNRVDVGKGVTLRYWVPRHTVAKFGGSSSCQSVEIRWPPLENLGKPMASRIIQDGSGTGTRSISRMLSWRLCCQWSVQSSLGCGRRLTLVRAAPRHGNMVAPQQTLHDREYYSIAVRIDLGERVVWEKEEEVDWRSRNISKLISDDMKVFNWVGLYGWKLGVYISRIDGPSIRKIHQ